MSGPSPAINKRLTDKFDLQFDPPKLAERINNQNYNQNYYLIRDIKNRSYHSSIMTIAETPTFSCTVVSSELCRPWTEDSVMQNIEQRDPDLFRTISGVQLNNKGRIIELLIKCPNNRAKLLAKGLTFDLETIMFRPYNGVFALLKNIPLEITREGVLQLIQTMNWQINGPSPASRISPQFNILRDGRAILSGRWVCMLDKFPNIPQDKSGTKQPFTTAYGGRKIPYNVSFHRFPNEKLLGNDPNNYTLHQPQTKDSPSTPTQQMNSAKDNTMDPTKNSAVSQQTAENTTGDGNSAHIKPKVSSAPPAHIKEPEKTPSDKKKQKKLKKTKEKSATANGDPNKPNKPAPRHPGTPPQPPLLPNPLESISDGSLSEDEPPTISDFPSQTIKIQVYGFSTQEPKKLLQDLKVDCLYTPSNYPPVEFTRFHNAPTDTAYIMMPKEIGETLIKKNGSKFAGEKLTIQRHKKKSSKHNIAGLTIQNLHTDITHKEIIDSLQFAHEPTEFNKLTHFALVYDEETHTRTFSFQVPVQQFLWFSKPIKINGTNYPVTVAHASNKKSTTKEPSKGKIELTNYYSVLDHSKVDEPTEESGQIAENQESEYEIDMETEQVQQDEDAMNKQTSIHQPEELAQPAAELMDVESDSNSSQSTQSPQEEPPNQNVLIINNISQIENTIIVHSPIRDTATHIPNEKPDDNSIMNACNLNDNPQPTSLLTDPNQEEEYLYTDWGEFNDAEEDPTIVDQPITTLVPNSQSVPCITFNNPSLIQHINQENNLDIKPLVPYPISSTQQDDDPDLGKPIIDLEKLLLTHSQPYAPPHELINNNQSQSHPNQNEISKTTPNNSLSDSTLIIPSTYPSIITDPSRLLEYPSELQKPSDTGFHATPTVIPSTFQIDPDQQSIEAKSGENALVNYLQPATNVIITSMSQAEEICEPINNIENSSLSHRLHIGESQCSLIGDREDGSGHSDTATMSDAETSQSSGLVIAEDDNESLTPSSHPLSRAGYTSDDERVLVEMTESPITPDSEVNLTPTSQPENNKLWLTNKFVKARSPLHMDQSSLKRDHSTDEESSDIKKSRSKHPTSELSRVIKPPRNKQRDEYKMIEHPVTTIQTTEPSPDMNANTPSMSIPRLTQPPVSSTDQDYTTHGIHQFPIKPKSIQKCRKLFKENDPVAVEQVLDMIVLSNFNYTDLTDDPLHLTGTTQQEKNIITSTLLYLLIGQNESLISSWPKDLPPLPQDVICKWQKLCRKNTLPLFSADKLASLILKVTNKNVEHDEIDEIIRRIKTYQSHLKIKSSS